MLLIATALAGCATSRVVESEVRAFSILAPQPGTAGSGGVGNASYRFERLPSQQADATGRAQQSLLEAAAEPALARVGLVRVFDPQPQPQQPPPAAPLTAPAASDAPLPRFAVQLAARAQWVLVNEPFEPDPRWGWYGPWGGWPWGNGWNRPWSASQRLGYGAGFGFGGLHRPMAPSRLQIEIALTLRESASGRVVYETHALHQSLRGADASRDPATLAALFDAALRGFPQPASGVVRVILPPPEQGGIPAATPAGATGAPAVPTATTPR